MLAQASAERIRMDFVAEVVNVAFKRDGKLVGSKEILFKCVNEEFHSDGADEKPSCSMNVDTGLWKCHACGAKGNPITIAQKLGVTIPKKRRPRNGTPKREGHWFYQDEDGINVIEVEKWCPSLDGTRDKGFRQRKVGSIEWSVSDARRVLYRLPELLKTEPGSMILLPEGEEKADWLVTLGFCATTNVGGAASWKQEYITYFRDRHVVILQDNDKAGENRSRKLAPLLATVAASVKVLLIPNLPDKGDIADWIVAGGTAEQLMEMIQARPVFVPSSSLMISMSSPNNQYNRNEDGNAQRFVRLHKDDFRFDGDRQKWLQYDGKRWEPDTSGAVIQAMLDVARELHLEADQLEHGTVPATTEAKMVRKWAVASGNHSTVKDALVLARSLPGMTVKASQLDRYPLLVNCQNGILDLELGELLPHDPTRLLTTMVPAEFHEDAVCPRWEALLDYAMFGDQQMVDYIQRQVGYWIGGLVNEQVFFMHEGESKAGKSTFFDTLKHLFDQLAGITPAKLLFETIGEQHPAGLATLVGKRLAICQDADEGVLAEGMVKRLTGDRTHTARYMRGNFFEFPGFFKLVFVCNDKPYVRGQHDAIWNRVRITHWGRVVPVELRDETLFEKLIEKTELDGIFNWAAIGARKYFAERLNTPKPMMDQLASYRLEMDQIGRWLEERCVIGAEFQCPINALWESFCYHAETRREKTGTMNRFARELTRKGYVTDPANPRMRLNLDLLENNPGLR